MAAKQEAQPFTPKQLDAFRSDARLTGRERRLLATIDLLIRRSLEKSDSRQDELAREVDQLRGQLANVLATRERYRVLIVGMGNNSIEVFADSKVKVAVTAIPESSSTKDSERAEEWALQPLPYDFKGITNDPAIRPEVYSVRCLTRVEWAYCRDRIDAHKYLEKLGSAIEGVTKQDG